MFDFAILAIGGADEADRITAVALNLEMKGERFAFDGYLISTRYRYHANIKYHNVWLQMKNKMAEDRVLKRFETLTLKKWDEANKRVDETQTETIKANLLIVATGRAAANDKLVTQVLGFSYSNLEPVNYMALRIFNCGSSNDAATESEAQDSVYEKALEVSQQIAQGGICFQTAEYDYLLANLSGITKTDFAKIKQNQVYLRDLVIALRRTSPRSTGVREETHASKKKSR